MEITCLDQNRVSNVCKRASISITLSYFVIPQDQVQYALIQVLQARTTTGQWSHWRGLPASALSRWVIYMNPPPLSTPNPTQPNSTQLNSTMTITMTTTMTITTTITINITISLTLTAIP